ncbi:hypothetical protein CIG19_02260 [Enterobacterales bacterium CwR94]|nr:hypothetical protein CIG19_02260 [Enterobacterales bacterium CwR94]
MLFIDDAELGYRAAAKAFSAGDTLEFDEAYRRAHLPLLDPHHPKVIQSSADYVMGRYPTRRYSLVIPVNAGVLAQSRAFQQMDLAIRQSHFSGAIAWQKMARRRPLLHITLCGGFAESALPEVIQSVESWTQQQIKPRFQLRGIFAGGINTGRLYLKAYPERREGRNPFQEIQQAVGKPATELWLAGYYNFYDELDVAQTAQLAAIIEKYQQHLLLELTCNELWLLGTHDDLVLSGEKVQRFKLN